MCSLLFRLLQVIQTVVENVQSVPFVFSAPYLGLIVEDVGNQTNHTYTPDLTNLVATVSNKTGMLPNVSSAELVSSTSASLSSARVAHGSRAATTLFTHDNLFQQRPNFTAREEVRDLKQVGSVIVQITTVNSPVTGVADEGRAVFTFTKTEVCANVCVNLYPELPTYVHGASTILTSLLQTAREFGENPACQTWNFTLDGAQVVYCRL